MIGDQNVQVSDTTEDDSSNAVGSIITSYYFEPIAVQSYLIWSH